MRKTLLILAAAALLGGLGLPGQGSAAPIGPGMAPSAESAVVQVQMSERGMMNRRMSRGQMMRSRSMRSNRGMMRSNRGMMRSRAMMSDRGMMRSNRGMMRSNQRMRAM